MDNSDIPALSRLFPTGVILVVSGILLIGAVALYPTIRYYLGHVITDDAEFARSLLDAQMIDLMLRGEGKISFEFFGHYLLLHTVRVEPELVAGLARFAAEFSSVVPPLVQERWPASDADR